VPIRYQTKGENMLYHGQKLELEYDTDGDGVTAVIVRAWTVDSEGKRTELDLTDEDVVSEIYLIDTRDTLRKHFGLKD
jgi:hypothetical protein